MTAMAAMLVSCHYESYTVKDDVVTINLSAIEEDGARMPGNVAAASVPCGLCEVHGTTRL